MVSVIIPNYNHVRFLKQRMNSVLNQTYQDFEIIILDDCSTDKSRDIIETYRDHPKVSHIVYNEKNSGSTFKQWNKGIALAQGTYIWIAESDDVADKEFLQTLVPYVTGNKQLSVVYAQSYELNEKDEVTGSWLSWTDDLDPHQFLENFVMNGLIYIDRFLIHRNTIPNASGVVFKKNSYLQVGGADETIKNCSDWLFWMKMLLSSDVAFVAKPLNYFRYHEGSVIATATKRSDPKRYWEIYDRTMRKQLNEYLDAGEEKNVLLKKILRQNKVYILEDDGREAVFDVQKGRWVKGYIKLFKASMAGPTLSFFRLLLKSG